MNITWHNLNNTFTTLVFKDLSETLPIDENCVQITNLFVLENHFDSNILLLGIEKRYIPEPNYFIHTKCRRIFNLYFQDRL
jgi:hypothetical protein